MKKMRLSQLSEPVRSFLEQVRNSESIMIVDENDQLQCGITPYYEASPDERRKAQRSLEELQEKVARSMQEQGVTEDDVIRELLKDE
jgi:hypothetical protein